MSHIGSVVANNVHASQGAASLTLSNEQYQQLLAFMSSKASAADAGKVHASETQINAAAGVPSYHSQEWIIDSGATYHITALFHCLNQFAINLSHK
ncbi:unnamed protein product [Prunus armeniaca]